MSRRACNLARRARCTRKIGRNGSRASQRPLLFGLGQAFTPDDPAAIRSVSRAFQRPSRAAASATDASFPPARAGRLRATGRASPTLDPLFVGFVISVTFVVRWAEVVTRLCAQTCRVFMGQAGKVRKTYLPRPGGLRPIRTARSCTFVRTNV